MKIIIVLLKNGYTVINVTQYFIAFLIKNGEVDIIPLVKDEMGLRVDIEKIVTIGYGNNTVQASTDEIMVTTF